MERHALVEQSLPLQEGLLRRPLDALGLTLDTVFAIGKRAAESVAGTGVARSPFLVSIAIGGHVLIVPRRCGRIVRRGRNPRLGFPHARETRR